MIKILKFKRKAELRQSSCKLIQVLHHENFKGINATFWNLEVGELTGLGQDHALIKVLLLVKLKVRYSRCEGTVY